MKTVYKFLSVFFVLAFFQGCEDALEENIYSQLSPSTLLTSEKGVASVLNSAYSYAHRNDGGAGNWSPYYLGSSPAGEFYGKGGSIESLWVQLENFSWDANHGQIISQWPIYYRAIRDANVVLDNLDPSKFSAAFVASATAEAKFIRGWAYSELYKLYGRLPLHKSLSDDPLQVRASDAETRAYIEENLLAAIPALPDTGPVGRATKGAARGVLCKYYLNTKQWQKAADIAKEIIDMGKFGLETTFDRLYSLTNENNKEMLWSLPKIGAVAATANSVQALVFPPTYPRPYTNNGVFAARLYLFDAFVNSFQDGDKRKSLIVTEWKLANGTPQIGLGKNESFPNKYPWDPNSAGWQSGNDVPVIRYADILISRAEALNEQSGPSQDALDLINLVRTRAGVPNLTLTGLTRESLREAILKERSWEFFYEGKTREDLLRHDLFITRAVARGKNAKPHHVLYPIPQTELDANKLLEQNPGY